MITKEIFSEEYYTRLIGYASSILQYTLPQIREKYADYPICLMDYIEKDIHERSIEIRFDKEEVTLTCTFNDNGECISTFLFPDYDETIERFIDYLTESHDYNFVKSRFSLSNCFVKIKELKDLPSNVCLLFYS